MAKRVKKTIITGITAGEAEEAFASYAKADAQQTKITAEIEFRTGQPKFKTARGTTWADALELVKDRLPNYIRTKEEVDKDRLLADRNLPCRRDDEPEEAARPLLHEMALCGILVVQEESFFVEPKREEAAS